MTLEVSLETPDLAPVLLRHEGPLAFLTLNRPSRLNAVSLPLYNALAEVLQDLRNDSAVRAVLITGAGRAFCVGADLKAHGEAEPTREERRRYAEAGQRVYRALQTLPQPVVAAVNGHAIGAGLELALSCDVIVVADEAKLRFPELALGTFVGGGLTYTLMQRVGVCRAKELVFLAEFFDGKEAARIGLVNRCVPTAEVLLTATTLAQRLAAMAPLPLALAKQLFDQAWHMDAEAALKRETEALLQCMETSDWREGIEAFHERREPRFTGS
jgi:enoyl-CoA hydratase